MGKSCYESQENHYYVVPCALVDPTDDQDHPTEENHYYVLPSAFFDPTDDQDDDNSGDSVRPVLAAVPHNYFGWGRSP